MQIVYTILFEAGKILSYLLIVIAFLVSGFILFQPAKIIRFNAWLNTYFCTRQVSRQMNLTVDTTELVLKNRWLIGILFLLGTLFTGKYMLMDFVPDKFVNLVVRPSNSTSTMLYQMLFASIRWLFIVCSALGTFICLTLLFWPELFRKLSHKLDRVVSTEHVGDMLDTTHNLVDEWVFKHHIAVGLFLFLASCYLVVGALFIYR